MPDTNLSPLALATVDMPAKELSAAVAVLTKNVAARSTFPSLRSIRLVVGKGRMHMSASNGVDTVLQWWPHSVTADVSGACDVLLEPKALAAAVKASGALTVYPDHVAVGAFRLPAVQVDDAGCHRYREPEGEPVSVALSGAAEWARLMDVVAPCASTEDTRYYLNGVLLTRESGVYAPDGRLTAVATDGHRLAAIPFACPPEGGDWRPVILPTASLRVITAAVKHAAKTRDVDGAIITQNVMDAFGGCKQISVTVGRWTAHVTPIGATFPDFRRVIPDASKFSAVTFTKAEAEAFRQTLASLASAHDKRKAARIDFTAGGAQLVCSVTKETTTGSGRNTKTEYVETEAFRAPLACTLSPDIKPKAAVGFNIRYMVSALAALRAAGGSGFTLRIETEKGAVAAPMLFEAPGVDATCVLMPMRT